MGVGAAIAKGNQEEKGKRALLVINVTKSKTLTPQIVLTGKKEKERFKEEQRKAAMERRKKQSPIRFIKRVKTPDVMEDWLW